MSAQTDEEVVVDVDVDAEVPCCQEGCDHPAAWRMRFCCRACRWVVTMLMCNRCRLMAMTRIEWQRALGYRHRCDRCEVPTGADSVVWTPL